MDLFSDDDAPPPSPVRDDGIAIKEEEADHDPFYGSAFEDIDWEAQERQDEENINQMFSGEGSRMPEGADVFAEKEIDQTYKADDAIDFEDISDLASEDEDVGAAGVDISQVPGLTEDEGTSHDTEYMDDLFGDRPGDNDDFSSPPPAGDITKEKPATTPTPGAAAAVIDDDVTEEAWKNMSFEERQKLNFPLYSSSIDKWMNQMNNEDASTKKTPEDMQELVNQRFPGFQKYERLFFNHLFPEWPAEYIYKQPLNKDRDPPEFVPTKLELELEADSAKLFRIPENVLAAQRFSNGDEEDWGDETDSCSASSESEESTIGGFNLDEITTICYDWDAALTPPESENEEANEDANAKVNGVVANADEEAANVDEEMDEWDKEFLVPQAQAKPPPRNFKPGLPMLQSLDTRGVDNFEREIRRTSKRIRLDYDDPYLLLIRDNDWERPAKRPKIEERTKRMANGQLGKDVLQHYNLSNDTEYEGLKVNSKSKVRATLSNLSVEHSLPALKLTFPFYRVKASGKPWEHNRKKFEIEKVVKHAIGVRKPSKVRRKDTKGKTNQEIFRTTKDLSLNDNSTTVLFEYCEEFPVMMSKFGMGSRVINYYRRKDRNDEDKIPKLDLGEGHPLLPEDRSPFSIFGTVDPGETVPTLHNEMYRAPIFKHESRPNDFILGYSTNATEGPKFYLRNIDHVYTVGQTFPSLEVPGPHARKVTNTVKNRLKMVAYRIMKKKETQDVSLAEITPHVFEKADPQNRQKMKEFLQYDRERKTWVLPEDQTLMDATAIRSMIKPEDACLLEAMQVGQQLLANAGYDPKDNKEEGDEGVEEPLVAKMAPWELTKNFIDASAGKAMVALHGEGDPTGHGLGFSFIKTSMKGGYINAVQGPLATSADAIERERKANGGHSYNVKKQQDMYNAAIRQIWERQKTTLSDPTTHDDADVLDTANEDDRFEMRQAEATPIPLDDGRSQFSRTSAASRAGKRLKITRKKRDENGEIITETIYVSDPIVARNYVRLRKEAAEKNRELVLKAMQNKNSANVDIPSVYSLQPTADATDNREKQRLSVLTRIAPGVELTDYDSVDKELSRLLKNQDRRQVREKAGKGKKRKVEANRDATPDPASVDKVSTGTTRKCANCGQVGHIKTNKRCVLHRYTFPLE